MRPAFDRLRPDYRWMLWQLMATRTCGLTPDVLARIDAERERIVALPVTTRTIPLA